MMPVEQVVNKESTCTLTVSNSFDPVTMTYRVHDKHSSTLIRPETSVSSPGTTVTITLTEDDTVILDATHESEVRVVTVTATDSSGNQHTEVFEFTVTNNWPPTASLFDPPAAADEFLTQANNLSDLDSASTARTNLGLVAIASSGSASDLTTGTLNAARLPNTAVTAGSYTNTSITVDATGRITAASSGTGGGGVWGAITGTLSSQTDLNNALAAKAPLASPALTGTPTAPTAIASTNTTQIATTAFVQAELTNVTDRVTDLESDVSGLATDKAPLASPTFTGTITAAAGSTAAPTIRFGTDTNTGIYQNGANTIAFAVSGGEYMRISTGGVIYVFATMFRATTGVYFSVSGNDRITQNGTGILRCWDGTSNIEVQMLRSTLTQGAAPTVSSGSATRWVASGSGTKDGVAYDQGDVLITSNFGGTSKTVMIMDWSAA